ncbi:DUF4443 domain-containing protein [Candidatus Nitrosotenuis cloacae]|uniref:DUF4443 domain-containing protein n=1 Tax=Candidatus Nitrosotenuis cloacae TaxID=1603555 RepID=UPI002282DAB3|nr:DUF4443 domain-containing protein [Candidatus Nitrosotenuis cloacae]
MNAKQQVQTLQNIVSRKGSSKILTFSVPHVFKALHMLYKDQYVSRSAFCNHLHMGEGAVKTMIAHLKKESMVGSTKSGTFLTDKGRSFIKSLLEVISAECEIKKCNITRGKFNHAVLLKRYAFATKSGMEQRDYSILYGASGATTLIYKDDRFVFPNETIDCLLDDKKTRDVLISNLCPENGDMIIIATADDQFVADIAAKNSALWTLAIHGK